MLLLPAPNHKIAFCFSIIMGTCQPFLSASESLGKGKRGFTTSSLSVVELLPCKGLGDKLCTAGECDGQRVSRNCACKIRSGRSRAGLDDGVCASANRPCSLRVACYWWSTLRIHLNCCPGIVALNRYNDAGNIISNGQSVHSRAHLERYSIPGSNDWVRGSLVAATGKRNCH